MEQNIFARSRKENVIFKNERYLYPEFVPERLPHRDSQINSIVYAFNPILQGSKPHNIFVSGPTGTGKTVTIKYVLGQLEEYSDRAKSIYVNCFEFDSRNAILSRIASELEIVVPRRGLSTDEIYSKIIEKMKKISFTPVVILDEIDQLANREEHSSLLYDLLRAVEYQKNRFGVVILSNDSGFTAKLDARVKSSLLEERIEFPAYSPQQLKDILRERAEQAFMPNVLETEVINVAAAHAAKNGGDARIAIESLWKAGREAEGENSPKVKLSHLRTVLDKIMPSPSRSLGELSQQEKKLLKHIDENDGITAKELYEKVQGLSERRIRELLQRLEDKSIIKSKPFRLGRRGLTKKLFLIRDVDLQ